MDHASGKNVDNIQPKSSKDEGRSLMELSGYNEKRQEFDLEYDNDAELLLADMEFKETDTLEEHELKLRVLHIYSSSQCVMMLGKRDDAREFMRYLHPDLGVGKEFAHYIFPCSHVICCITFYL